MFDWLLKKSNTKETPLQFSTGQEAFDYACSQCNSKLKSGAKFLALVVEGDEQERQPKGRQQEVLVRVCSLDGGFNVLSSTRSGAWPRLVVGDLVEWGAGQFAAELAERFPDKRSAWAGQIYAKLKAEFSPVRGWSREFEP